MKFPNEQLKQIIKEELEVVLNEGVYSTIKGAFPPLNDAKKFVERFSGEFWDKPSVNNDIRFPSFWPFFSALDRVTDEKVRKEIVRLTEHQFVNLYLEKHFVGHTMTLPKSIGYFPKMEKLTIIGHSFKTIPDSFKNLINLEELDLRNNEIEKLPWFLVKHPSLKRLYLELNPIRKALVFDYLKYVKRKGNDLYPSTMVKWLQDSKYWANEGEDLMYGPERFDKEGNFLEPEKEKDVFDILGATPEERDKAEMEVAEIERKSLIGRLKAIRKKAGVDPISHEPESEEEMQKKAKADLEKEMSEEDKAAKDKLTWIRAISGLPMKERPKPKELSPRVKEKLRELEMIADRIAVAIVDAAFRSEDVITISSLGFTKDQSRVLAVGVVPRDLVEKGMGMKEVEEMAIKNLLKAKQGEFDYIGLGAGVDYEFDPDKGDLPAGALDVMFLLRRSLSRGKLYKGQEMQIEDGEFYPFTNKHPLKWELIEEGEMGYSIKHIKLFSAADWNWVDASEEYFNQEKYEDYINKKARSEKQASLKNMVTNKMLGKGDEGGGSYGDWWDLAHTGGIVKKGEDIYLMHSGRANKKGLIVNKKLKFNKEAEKWGKEIEFSEFYDKRKNLLWLIYEWKKDNRQLHDFFFDQGNTRSIDLGGGGLSGLRGLPLGSDDILWHWSTDLWSNKKDGSYDRHDLKSKWRGDEEGWSDIKYEKESFYDQKRNLNYVIKKFHRSDSGRKAPMFRRDDGDILTSGRGQRWVYRYKDEQEYQYELVGWDVHTFTINWGGLKKGWGDVEWDVYFEKNEEEPPDPW